MKMYSVEWIPANSHYNCWNQHALTHSRFIAMLLALEVRLSRPCKTRYRTRTL